MTTIEEVASKGVKSTCKKYGKEYYRKLAKKSWKGKIGFVWYCSRCLGMPARLISEKKTRLGTCKKCGAKKLPLIKIKV